MTTKKEVLEAVMRKIDEKTAIDILKELNLKYTIAPRDCLWRLIN